MLSTTMIVRENKDRTHPTTDGSDETPDSAGGTN